MNLNINQIFAIAIAVLGVLVASTAQLTDLFGPAVTQTIVSMAGLSMSILSSILGVFTGQAGMVKTVASMPGVEPIRVNAQANPTLARIALDPDVDKVEAKPGTESTVQQIAKQ